MCEKILYSKEQIKNEVERIGKQINDDYKDKEIVFICVLNGSFVFTSDLVREVELPCSIEFMQVSTYGSGTQSTGVFNIKKDISCDLHNKHVIIVEDIVDSGFTLYNLKEYIISKNPASVKIATLIDKPARRTCEMVTDYVGFVMDKDEFIVGYGLDYADKYRNLPYVGILK